MNIGSRITRIRKEKNWSQTELAKVIGVSRVIIGRYERDEASPSIDIAKRMADAFEVSLDYLIGQGQNAQFDKKTLEIIEEIEKLEPSIKDKLFFLVNAVIRDYKTQQAYK